MDSAKVKNQIIKDHKSLLGYDWLRGMFLLPALTKWGEKITGTLVDVGCGHKPYKSLIGKNASRYVGVDAPNADADADMRADALELPFPDNSVDATFNSWLLDDIPEPTEYFRELSRILKPHGVAIMVENQSYPEHDAPHDYFRFTKFGLANLARKNGFVVEEMMPFGGFWAHIGLDLSSFFLRGVAGHVGGWVRIFLIVINPVFYALDRINFMPRGTSGYFAVFRKTDTEK